MWLTPPRSNVRCQRAGVAFSETPLYGPAPTSATGRWSRNADACAQVLSATRPVGGLGERVALDIFGPVGGDVVDVTRLRRVTATLAELREARGALPPLFP